jgi:hypothetical protein
MSDAAVGRPRGYSGFHHVSSDGVICQDEYPTLHWARINCPDGFGIVQVVYTVSEITAVPEDAKDDEQERER